MLSPFEARSFCDDAALCPPLLVFAVDCDDCDDDCDEDCDEDCDDEEEDEGDEEDGDCDDEELAPGGTGVIGEDGDSRYNKDR